MKKFAIIITLLSMSAFAANDSQTTTKKTSTTTTHTPSKKASKKTSSSTTTPSSSTSESTSPSSDTSSEATTPPSSSNYEGSSSTSGSTSDTSSSLSDSSSPSGATTGASASSSSAQLPAKPTKDMVDKLVSQWPSESSKAAKAIIAKYGQPNEVTESMLIWKNNSPWKRTIVMRDGVEHMFPQKHMDVIQQFVDYKVPVDKLSDLARFDGSLMFDRTRGELSARGDTEESNFLAINLAKDIIDGTKTVDAARSQFGKSGAITASVNKDYVKGLKFSTSSAAADPDVAYKEESSSSKTGSTSSDSSMSQPSSSDTSTSTGGVTTPSTDSSTNSNSTSDSPSTNSPEQR
jgi:hypothetical protein